MSIRLILAAAVICFSHICANAQTPKPTVVLTAKPISRLLSEYREMIQQIGGPAEGERVVKGFDDQLKEHLGEQGFEGLDINRPFAAYTVVKEKFEDTNPILILPITGEKEFIAFLKRMKMEASAVKDKKGLYMLRVRGLDFLPNDSFVQFVDSWAYVGLNGDDVGDAKNRLPIDNLFDNTDLALITARFFPENFPEKLLKEWLKEMDNGAMGIKGFIVNGPPPEIRKLFETFFDEGPKLVRRYAETGIKEAQEVRLQFSWEPNTGDTFTELILTPRAGTQLAKDIAGKATLSNRFAGLKQPNAVLAAVVKAPLFAKELQEIGVALVGAIEGGGKLAKVEESFHPLMEEVAKSAAESVKKGDCDIALALVGPDKEGLFTVVAALSLTDTAAIDKTLRQLAKGDDRPKDFEFDVEKVAGVGIHKVPLARAAGEEIMRHVGAILGDKPPSYVAIAKDALYVSIGPESLAAVKTAMAAKPGPAPALELTGNFNRFLKYIPVLGARENDVEKFARLFGTDDKQVNLLSVTVEGGQTLKAKATLNVRYLPRLQFLD
jgi:hypothetical protein